MRNKYFLVFALAFVSVALFAQVDHTKTTVWKAEGDPAAWVQTADDTVSWTRGTPWNTQKTVFNVPSMADCEVTSDTAVCGQLVLGDNNNMGGKLIVKNGGVLTCGLADAQAWTGVSYNRSAHVVVEAGGTFISNQRMHVGMLEAPSDTMHSILEVYGTVDVTENVFSIDHNGWSGQPANVKIYPGGVIMCPRFSMGPNAVMDVEGGLLIVKGVHDSLLTVYSTGDSPQLTGEGGFEPPTITVHYGWDTVTVVSTSTSPEYVGVNDRKVATETLSVYPNPATDVVYFNGVDRADVKVYSITGQLVLERKDVSEISIETLNSGLYFIEATADKKKFVGKVLVK